MSIFNLAAFSEDLSRLRRAAFEATAAYALAPLTRQPVIRMLHATSEMPNLSHRLER
ncbi:hypothetical protein [Bradyrhizobium sp. 5.13L]